MNPSTRGIKTAVRTQIYNILCQGGCRQHKPYAEGNVLTYTHPITGDCVQWLCGSCWRRFVTAIETTSEDMEHNTLIDDLQFQYNTTPSFKRYL